MKKKKWFFAAAAILLLGIMALMGCAQQEGQSGETAETAQQGAGLQGSPGEAYYMIVPQSGDEYWYPVFATFKEAGNRLGVRTVYVGAAEPDEESQAAAVEQALKENPKGIFVSPATSGGLKDVLDKAVDQGVAVVTFAVDSPESKRQAYIGASHEEEGAQAAYALAEELQGQGKVMVLRNMGDAACEERTDAFVSVITTNYPGVEIVADDTANGDGDTAKVLVNSAAQAHADLAGVFCPDTASALGAAAAAEEADSDIKCVCVGAGVPVLDLISEGGIWLAVCPDQGMQGYFGMTTLFTAAHPDLVSPMNDRKRTGENPVDIPYINSGINLIKKENAEHYYIANYAELLGYDRVDELIASGGE
ncbi:substrate-binding domain-containing protein [Christensenellaceae bacterium OttesenSCG-928-K19]|nr:substrate-binding domain-containing protein [Christensenellaceae bacterium OttesenSCG-928-K19]